MSLDTHTEIKLEAITLSLPLAKTFSDCLIKLLSLPYRERLDILRALLVSYDGDAVSLMGDFASLSVDIATVAERPTGSSTGSGVVSSSEPLMQPEHNESIVVEPAGEDKEECGSEVEDIGGGSDILAHPSSTGDVTPLTNQAPFRPSNAPLTTDPTIDLKVVQDISPFDQSGHTPVDTPVTAPTTSLLDDPDSAPSATASSIPQNNDAAENVRKSANSNPKVKLLEREALVCLRDWGKCLTKRQALRMMQINGQLKPLYKFGGIAVKFDVLHTRLNVLDTLIYNGVKNKDMAVGPTGLEGAKTTTLMNSWALEIFRTVQSLNEDSRGPGCMWISKEVQILWESAIGRLVAVSRLTGGSIYTSSALGLAEKASRRLFDTSTHFSP